MGIAQVEGGIGRGMSKLIVSFGFSNQLTKSFKDMRGKKENMEKILFCDAHCTWLSMLTFQPPNAEVCRVATNKDITIYTE